MNSRPQRRAAQTWRRRQCLECSAIFTTIEGVDYPTTFTVRSPAGSLQPFNRDRLFVNILQACGHRTTAVTDAGALTTTIMSIIRKDAVNGLLERKNIITAAISTLKRFDKAAAVQYAAYHKG